LKVSVKIEYRDPGDSCEDDRGKKLIKDILEKTTNANK
jgi:hypothetical protein